MKSPRSSRSPSASLVVSIIALVVAMSGTGYAALKLPAHSVGSKQLKKNSVTSLAVKNHSLRALDFKKGALKAGPTGPRGLKGDAGAPGSALAYAHVLTNGTLDTAHSKNVSASYLSGVSPAAFCLTVSVPVSVASITVDGGNDSGLQGDAIGVLSGQDPDGRIPAICPAGGNAFVATYNVVANTFVPLAVWVVFN